MPRKGSSTPVLDRIATKYHVNPSTSCWEWNGSLSSQGKYPTIHVEGKHPDYVYRVLWIAENGPIPTELPSDGSHRWEHHHVCLNHSCVNPQHVILVSAKEHRAIHKGLRATARGLNRKKPIPTPMPAAPATAVPLLEVA